MSTNIDDLHNTEIISNLIRRLKLTPVRAGLYVAIFNFVSAIILALSFHAWKPRGLIRGFSTDLPTLAYETLLFPVGVGFFVWLQSSITQLFKHLVRNDSQTIFIDIGSVDDEITAYVRYLQHPKLPVYAGRFSVLFGVVAYLSLTNTILPNSAPTWLIAHPAIAFARSITYPIYVYCLLLTVYDLFILVYMLNKLFGKYQIRVNPYHCDHAGGLGEIGHFSANLGYLLASVGITLALSVIYDVPGFLAGKDYALAIYVIIYIFLSPLVFL